ncbi:MAG: Rrf2 family transcriptional regulator [Acidobacteriota bacterium]
MLSQTSRYALRILGHLASRPGDWVQGVQIAQDTGIPANYLSKILNQLRKRGFVLSQKGWGGGFRLAPGAERQPILQVLEVFDGPRAEGQCLFGLARCDKDNPCPLHAYWESIQATYTNMMQAITIADLHGPASAGRGGASGAKGG